MSPFLVDPDGSAERAQAQVAFADAAGLSASLLCDADHEGPMGLVAAMLVTEHAKRMGIPYTRGDGTLSCCHGLGEHFSWCEWATWEAR